jgi:hypothetical protein
VRDRSGVTPGVTEVSVEPADVLGEAVQEGEACGDGRDVLRALAHQLVVALRGGSLASNPMARRQHPGDPGRRSLQGGSESAAKGGEDASVSSAAGTRRTGTRALASGPKRARAARRRLPCRFRYGCRPDRLPASGEMQVARIFTSETCLAVIAVLSPTPTRAASVSGDGLRLHARCGRWQPLLVWRPPRLADRCGGRRLPRS